MRGGLRVRILLALGLLLAATVALLGLLAAPVLRASIVQEQMASLAATLAAAELAVADLDPASAERLVAAVAAPAGRRVVRIASDGRVSWDSSGTVAAGAPWTAPLVPGVVVTAPGTGDSSVLEAWSPTGGLLIQASLTSVDQSVARAMALLLLYAGVAAALLLLAGYLLLTARVVLPIGALAEAFSRAGGGIPEPVPVDASDELGRLTEAFNRMTSRLRSSHRELEERIAALTEATQQLERARDEAVRREKLAVVGQLAAGVAHEVGNPLQAVLGYTEILMSDTDPEVKRSGVPRLPREERLDILERVHREIERIQKIVGDLVGYSRPDRSDGLEPVPLGPVLSEAVKLLAPQPRMRNVEVVLSLPEEAVTAWAAEGGVTQVVVNLLLNAADAVDGSGRVEVGVARDVGGQGVSFWVEDDGPGIPADVLPRIFDPFFTTKDPGHGTGLGLATCHRLVDGFGGRLEAANVPEGGTRITVHLPGAEEGRGIT